MGVSGVDDILVLDVTPTITEALILLNPISDLSLLTIINNKKKENSKYYYLFPHKNIKNQYQIKHLSQ